MRAIVKYGEKPGEVDLIDIPEPVCGDGQVKIAIKACGICATDLHIMEGSYPWATNLPLGHEFSGEVVEVGKGVTSFSPGDRVAACMDGGFAEFAVKDAGDWVFRLPDNVSYEEGALLEPLCAGVNSVIRRSRILPYDLVLIEGPGPIGLFVLQAAKLVGARTIVSGMTKDGERLALAKELGSDYVIDVEKEDLEGFVADITDGAGVDFVMECTGVQSALDMGIAVLKTEGQLTQVGVFGKMPHIDLGRVVYHSQRVIGSIAFDRDIWRRCIGLLKAGKLNTKCMISHTLPLSQWKEGFELTKNQKGLRVLLHP